MKIKYKKLSNNAIIPTAAYDESAAIDLYSAKKVSIAANSVVAIDTDIAIEFPKGYFGKIEERSGFSKENTLCLKAGVIDNDYRGNIAVLFQNTGSYPVTVEAKTKIAQLIFLPYIKIELEQADILSTTARGEKGFGSTDKQK